MYACGRDISKIGLYTQNQMSSYLDKIRNEMCDFIDGIIHKNDRQSHSIRDT
jgi:hypothetical protein